MPVTIPKLQFSKLRYSDGERSQCQLRTRRRKEYCKYLQFHAIVVSLHYGYQKGHKVSLCSHGIDRCNLDGHYRTLRASQICNDLRDQGDKAYDDSHLQVGSGLSALLASIDGEVGVRTADARCIEQLIAVVLALEEESVGASVVVHLLRQVIIAVHESYNSSD